MVNPMVLELVDSMSLDEQVELIHHVQQSWALADSPLTAEDRSLLDERIADMAANPDSGTSLDEFMAQARSRR